MKENLQSEINRFARLKRKYQLAIRTGKQFPEELLTEMTTLDQALSQTKKGWVSKTYEQKKN